jgi:hypothetical protein
MIEDRSNLEWNFSKKSANTKQRPSASKSSQLQYSIVCWTVHVLY